MEDKRWPYVTPGIPDELFQRCESVPITKEEVRAIQISKARITTGNTIYDVGCGSGSVSVEAAIQAGPLGVVFGIDHNIDAVNTTKNNASIFGLKNITTIHGEAASVIPTLPPANIILIGGTGGDTADILNLCTQRLVPGGRIVVGMILIETISQVLSVIDNTGLEDVDITQITILKSRRTGTGTMMLARNPVTIASASIPL
ncbi:MAG: precorrin-6Y C5,15-methyltransferase (decarboxylating) subunit CbiT [Cenarchaeum sp. SB0665_bin_23]|nr:precorrin-6Y C5,15-methyltransferase (decarboxylating) subunit CbiT [Cenarchaeum sp. SB0667_bin_13]MXY37642.1 precorrin-6Y C5,15-methyltransferase (decarboxylating) subunit CbiT [Cenarchaeum sp. SB0664_bin_35]MXY61568.1 precorrin-6Y C5,15-methyltransferase (decarboxylating) subunit CbiT [Cenarchaeum sp. SB0665_bin_23]MXZ94033.1 precorrin-6Y C5,15-methyltransferase (decarboxylating) subunit CbiT [Cenarchaeum sp. SB0666_bin_15]MYB47532.1 precorrin-6Y C5,15-methyltransferase (decarboxylating) s